MRIPLLLLIAAAAFGIAASSVVVLGGFTWGLPSSKHVQSYHPDEQNITYSLRNMKPHELDFNPRFYGNPTFYTYQMGALALAGSVAGVLPREMDTEYWLANPGAVRRFYILGRGLSLAYALGALVLVYLVARRLSGGHLAAVLATAIFASLPAFAVHSNYMTVNSSAVFWSLAALAVSLRIREQPSWQNYLLAGAFAGFAVSTKLNNALLPLAIFVAHLQAPVELRWQARLASGRLWAAAGVCVAAFFVGSPYYLLAFDSVRSDPHNQMNMAAFLSMSDPLGRVISDFWYHLSAACGPFMAGAFLVATPAVLLVDRRRTAPAVAVALPFLIIAVKSGWWAFPSRLLPLLALMPFLAAHLFEKSRSYSVARLLATLLLAGAFAACGIWNAAYFNLMRHEHIRAESSEWIASNIPHGSEIAVLETPYYDDPDVIYQTSLHPGSPGAMPYQIINLEGDYRALESVDVEWLVIPQRFEQKLADAGLTGITTYAQAYGFTLAKSFSREFGVFGLTLRDWVPADMVQQYPVYIFRRSVGRMMHSGVFVDSERAGHYNQRAMLAGTSPF